MKSLPSVMLTVCVMFVLCFAPSVQADDAQQSAGCGSAKMPCWSSEGGASKSSASEKQAFYEELLEPMKEEYIASFNRDEDMKNAVTLDEALIGCEASLQDILNSKVSPALVDTLEEYTPKMVNKILNNNKYNKSPVFDLFRATVRNERATVRNERATARNEIAKRINENLGNVLKKLGK